MTTNDTAHSKLPWKADGWQVCEVKDKSFLHVIANMSTPRAIDGQDSDDTMFANAAHIVKCVNSHEDLVNALEMCLSKLQREYNDGSGKISNLIYIQEAEAALAKAGVTL